MHIKDYPTHPEEYRLKEISDERPEKQLRIVRRTYNKYMKYNPKQLKATQIKDSNA
jgi:hypothetical protein